MNNETTILYRPVGPKELELIAGSGFREFPPRLPEQPIFYPVLNEEYARQIARDWNVSSSGAGYVTRFALKTEFAAKYPVQKVGSAIHQELWIPAEDLAEMNRNIVGLIEVIAEYKRNEPMTTPENSNELKRLRQNHAEARQRFEHHIACRSADLASFSRLEDELLAAERNLALAMGDEAALPWPLGAKPTSLSAVKLADCLRTLVLFEVKESALSSQTLRTAILNFDLCLSIRHGWPNDEAIHGHRLHGKGLSAYGTFVVQNSKWIGELEIRNRIHPNHKTQHFNDYKHFILCLKDETVEVVARNASLEIVDENIFVMASKLLSRLHFQ